MTPRSALEPFLRKLKNRENDLENKMQIANTTPEEHGECSACSNTAFELRIRLRMQDKGEIAEGWEEAYIAHLKKDPLYEQDTPGEKAFRQFECQFAGELEEIFRREGSIE